MRNVDLAEELAQDALVVALSEWPRTGVPANPGAWLMTTAKRRAIDAIRRDKMRERKHEEIARELDGVVNGAAEVIEVATSGDLGDELLGLIGLLSTLSRIPGGARFRLNWVASRHSRFARPRCAHAFKAVVHYPTLGHPTLRLSSACSW